MHRPRRIAQLLVALALLGAPNLSAQTESPGSHERDEPETATNPAVSQLRHAAGAWDATTDYLGPDGTVVRSVQGTYELEWIVRDRVLSGRSHQPELGQTAGILFYYEEAKNLIGMSSVGKDGHLWVMTGPADSEVRATPPTLMPDGTTLELRFTRYNVEPDRFESKMETSTDGGSSWTQRNHQVFTRRAAKPPSAEALDTSSSETRPRPHEVAAAGADGRS